MVSVASNLSAPEMPALPLNFKAETASIAGSYAESVVLRRWTPGTPIPQFMMRELSKASADSTSEDDLSEGSSDATVIKVSKEDLNKELSENIVANISKEIPEHNSSEEVSEWEDTDSESDSLSENGLANTSKEVVQIDLVDEASEWDDTDSESDASSYLGSEDMDTESTPDIQLVSGSSTISGVVPVAPSEAGSDDSNESDDSDVSITLSEAKGDISRLEGIVADLEQKNDALWEEKLAKMEAENAKLQEEIDNPEENSEGSEVDDSWLLEMERNNLIIGLESEKAKVAGLEAKLETTRATNERIR